MFRSFQASTLSPSGPFPASRREEGPTPKAVRILRWSSGLCERILASPPEAGRVHSVFERALNILWHDGGLITLHGPGLLAAPFAAAVTRLPQTGSVTPGMVVFRRGKRILFGPYALDIGGSLLVDTTIHPTDAGPGLLTSVLASTAMPVVASGLSSPSGRSAQRHLADGIRNREARTFVEGSCALIGLGEGLTPAGDDCLVGALAVLSRFAPAWLAEQPVIRTAITAGSEARTTTVAREFLLHALDGSFSEPVVHLMQARSAAEAIERIEDLGRMGASSGADTLWGMRLAMEALSQ